MFKRSIVCRAALERGRRAPGLAPRPHARRRWPPTQAAARRAERALDFGLHGRDPSTVANYRVLCEKHVISDLGARKLRELSAEDVDRWLVAKAKKLATRTVRLLYS